LTEHNRSAANTGKTRIIIGKASFKSISVEDLIHAGLPLALGAVGRQIVAEKNQFTASG